MKILKESVLIPLNRPLFIHKDGDLKLEDLVIETNERYRLYEKDDYFVIKNDDCCRSIIVTIKAKE